MIAVRLNALEGRGFIEAQRGCLPKILPGTGRGTAVGGGGAEGRHSFGGVLCLTRRPLHRALSSAGPLPPPGREGRDKKQRPVGPPPPFPLQNLLCLATHSRR